jgi:hypothetical protein
MEQIFTLRSCRAALLGGLMFASSAFANPIGMLNINGDVTVGLTTINFLGGMVAGAGTFGVGALTQEGDYTAVAGDSGVIRDLNSMDHPVGSTFMLDNFMTFPTAPTLSFRLEFIEPGIFSGTDCMASPAAGQSCTPFVGSPFNLTNVTSDSSTVSFVVRGTAFDAIGGTPFVGVFSSQFSDKSYQELLASLSTTGRVAGATYSANFNVVPETGTATMMLGGLMLIAFTMIGRWRRAYMNMSSDSEQ